jgi:hypothetical protein
MPYTYADVYLSAQAESREDRAIADVAQIGTFAQEWLDRLVPLRAYVLTCQECMNSGDDVFSAKLAAYRKEFDSTLSQAKAATDDADGNPLPALTVSLERA